MSRSALKVICIVSGILFVVLGIFTVVSVALILGTATASVGIIGGADAPTLNFQLNKIMHTPAFQAFAVAFLACAGTGIDLLFTKKEKK